MLKIALAWPASAAYSARPFVIELKFMRRPKGIKTKKSVTKRFKITGTGKVLRRHAGKRHLLQGKSSKPVSYTHLDVYKRQFSRPTARKRTRRRWRIFTGAKAILT